MSGTAFPRAALWGIAACAAFPVASALLTSGRADARSPASDATSFRAEPTPKQSVSRDAGAARDATEEPGEGSPQQVAGYPNPGSHPLLGARPHGPLLRVEGLQRLDNGDTTLLRRRLLFALPSVAPCWEALLDAGTSEGGALRFRVELGRAGEPRVVTSLEAPSALAPALSCFERWLRARRVPEAAGVTFELAFRVTPPS